MLRPVPLSARPVSLSARSVACSQPCRPVDVFAPHHALRAPSLALCVPHRAFSVARCHLPAPPRFLRLISRPEALFASHTAPSSRLVRPSHALPHHLHALLRRLDHPAVSLTVSPRACHTLPLRRHVLQRCNSISRGPVPPFQSPSRTLVTAPRTH
ncbi:hypothetical protein DENSPDRAFT_846080 [Dentipellis sp. KUC8613]|nr:hypothetical protein DENSPDRAFT_846080 [Dentipellis sp. KUC8613]